MVDQPTVVLIDIDGTLVDTQGAGRRAMQFAFEERAGHPDPCAFSFAGLTDKAIARRGLSAAGHEPTDAAIEALLAAYVQRLGAEIAGVDYGLLPGMSAALAHLRGLNNVAVGLGTGNLRAGARLKLQPVGLADAFAFGGFGCDHENRAALLRTGAQRGAAILRVPLEEARILVIGDTPLDVEAAQKVGAASLAVATGGHSQSALVSAGATYTVASFASSGALDALEALVCGTHVP